MLQFFCIWPVCRRTPRAPSTSVDQVSASSDRRPRALSDVATLSTGTSQKSQLVELCT